MKRITLIIAAGLLSLGFATANAQSQDEGAASMAELLRLGRIKRIRHRCHAGIDLTIGRQQDIAQVRRYPVMDNRPLAPRIRVPRFHQILNSCLHRNLQLTVLRAICRLMFSIG